MELMCVLVTMHLKLELENRHEQTAVSVCITVSVCVFRSCGFRHFGGFIPAVQWRDHAADKA